MALTPRNRQEEWYQEMINASTGNYLPSITQQDAGKVMTVESDGSWGVENVPSELPTVQTADKGKYLHANDSTGDVEWEDVPTELPSVTGSDEGKVLSVNNSGEWVASTPSAGGGAYWVNGSYDADTHALTLDKTAKELFDAASEQAVFLKIPEVDNDLVVVDDWYHVLLLEQFAKDNDGYLFVFKLNGTIEFSASADDEYPTKNFG